MERIEMNECEVQAISNKLDEVRLLRKFLIDQMQSFTIEFVGISTDFGLKDIHVTEESFYKIVQAVAKLDESQIKVVVRNDGRTWKSINYFDFNIFCIADKE